MSISTQAAVTAATSLAADRGLPCTDPVVLHDGSNVVVHLRPAPVVARVATLTALVRPGTEAWFTRDAQVAAHLAARGVPAVRPLDLPVVTDDTVIGLWHHEPHDPTRVPAPAEVAAALAGLHAALRDLPGDLPADLPRFGPCTDIDLGLPLVEHLLPAGAAALLRAENDRLRTAVADFPAQPLHGDAHPGNLLVTPAGLVWNDFEDTWSGPLGWDLACLATSGRFDGQAAVAAYPARPPAEELAVCVELRRLMGVVWRYVRVLRWPEYKKEADQHWESWLAAR
jgi:hypothetical protein